MSELQKALDRISKMKLASPIREHAVAEVVESEIAALTKQVEDLREAAQQASNLLTFPAIDDADALKAMTVLNKALAKPVSDGE